MGLVIPSLISIPVMGAMARILGIEKFGLFTLAFAVLGYAGIFDAGLTRAVIRSVAMHRGNSTKIHEVVGTASYAVLFMGLFAAALLWLNAAGLATLLTVSAQNFDDAVISFKWLSLAIPPFLLSMIWFSYLEGNERFAELNMIKTFTSSLIAIGPLVAVLIERSLVAAIIGFLLGRILAMLAAYYFCSRDMPDGVWTYDKKELKELFQFGGWITVSNIVSPLMGYFDRFILANLMGAYRVAFYTAPAEAVARLSIVPGAVARSLFPLLSMQADNSKAQAKLAFWGLLCVCSAIALPVFIFAKLIMTTWMGPEYGGDAALVLRILLVGFIFNALAQIPFSKIQARGYSKATALIHLVELCPYLVVLYLLTNRYSLLGAAVAWTLRIFIDFVLLQAVSSRIQKQIQVISEA